ncbi:MAG: hypothetical protein P8Y53_24595, partial [Pseudolabrys sp.]
MTLAVARSPRKIFHQTATLKIRVKCRLRILCHRHHRSSVSRRGDAVDLKRDDGMSGIRLKIYMLAAATLLAATAARAADLTPPPPPPPQPCCDNWYLRGYAGIGINGDYTLDYLQNPANSSNFTFDHQSIADTPFIGGAVGYAWNNWLRFDVSAEYRSKTRVYAFGHYTFGGGQFL